MKNTKILEFSAKDPKQTALSMAKMFEIIQKSQICFMEIHFRTKQKKTGKVIGPVRTLKIKVAA
jgi:hypothetical protein